MPSSTALSTTPVHTPFPISPHTASSSSTLSTITTTSSSSTSTSTTTTSTSSTTSDAPSETGVIVPGNDKYQYYGCYNESTAVNGTGGRRALYGGSMEGLDSMTVETCLEFCNIDGFTYAGLEYERECWCANYVSVYAAKLQDAECNFACKGNTSELCGGPLKLTIYQKISVPSAAPKFTRIPTKLFVAGLALAGLFLQMS